MTKKNTSSKACCKNCHFWVVHEHPSGPVDQAGRDSFEQGTEELSRCSHQVWDARSTPGIAKHVSEVRSKTGGLTYKSNGEKYHEALEKLVLMDRGESCFFYEYVGGMSRDSAYDLEARMAGRREGDRNRRHAFHLALIGLAAAICAAIIAACLTAALT
jgi:hypothetical protein